VVSSDAKPIKVLIVEDEASFLEALRVGLGREGFAIDVARDGREALERFAASEPDIILLDVMLPRISGIDVCREIRSTSAVPIIMVTAKGEEIDAVVGLEVGADDYVTKPYRFRELVARMRSVLRRAEMLSGQQPAETDSSGETDQPIQVGDVHIDLDRHEVTIRSNKIDMPLKEFDLLVALASNAGRVLTRDQLIDQVWGEDYVGDTKTLDVHIKRLRNKVETDPSKPTSIVTIRGLGYKFTDAG
jgi:two-component system response regulator RegX3